MMRSDYPVFTLKLDDLSYKGDAIGRLPTGKAVFVPYGLPGEVIRLQVVEEKQNYARGELLEIVAGSPEPLYNRIPARCSHFTHCGGCHFQHLPYPEQLVLKEKILREQLERSAGLKNPPVQTAVPSPEPWNYRNHMQFHLAPEGRLGFQAARSKMVLPIQECHLPQPPLDVIWPQLDFELVPGLERVGLRLGEQEEVLLVLESSDPQPVDFIVEELSLSAVHLGPGGALVLAGSDSIQLEVLGRAFRVSAGSFFQVNTGVAALMVEHLLAHLPFSDRLTALDVYSGVGLFSAFVAPRAAHVVGVEISTPACADYEYNLDEFDNVELYEAPVEEVLTRIQFKPEVIIIDPPRAGIGKRALEGICSQGANWLAYVSCDPTTLARDARHLAQSGYHLVQVTPFDMFPQTYHIESISLWEKLHAP